MMNTGDLVKDLSDDELGVGEIIDIYTGGKTKDYVVSFNGDIIVHRDGEEIFEIHVDTDELIARIAECLRGSMDGSDIAEVANMVLYDEYSYEGNENFEVVKGEG